MFFHNRYVDGYDAFPVCYLLFFIFYLFFHYEFLLIRKLPQVFLELFLDTFI